MGHVPRGRKALVPAPPRLVGNGDGRRPASLFEDWFAEARAAEPNDPEAMALATADADGRPSVRMVLLKGHDARGFAFYTNGESRKGDEIAANPRAALVFHWKSLRRQVRIEGRIEPDAPTPRPTPISPPARATRGSAPGRRTSRARSKAAPPSRRATRRLVAEHEGRDVPRPPIIGGAIGSSPTGSNSGPIGRTGCTSAACSPRPKAAGAKACSTHERRPSSPSSRPLLADHAGGAGERLHARSSCSRSRPLPRSRPARWRCWARSPTPASICSPLWSPCSGSASPRSPADHDHRFGHGKAEALAALVQVVIISISALAHRLARDRPADARATAPPMPNMASPSRWWRSRSPWS